MTKRFDFSIEDGRHEKQSRRVSSSSLPSISSSTTSTPRNGCGFAVRSRLATPPTNVPRDPLAFDCRLWWGDQCLPGPSGLYVHFIRSHGHLSIPLLHEFLTSYQMMNLPVR